MTEILHLDLVDGCRWCIPHSFDDLQCFIATQSYPWLPNGAGFCPQYGWDISCRIQFTSLKIRLAIFFWAVMCLQKHLGAMNDTIGFLLQLLSKQIQSSPTFIIIRYYTYIIQLYIIYTCIDVSMLCTMLCVYIIIYIYTYVHICKFEFIQTHRTRQQDQKKRQTSLNESHSV